MENTASQTAPKPEQIIRNWWEYYTAEPKEGEASRKGELATLRRCKTLEEIFFTPQYQNLYRQAAAAGWKDRAGIAAVAGILAHVKTASEGKTTVAEHFAHSKEDGGKTPLVSEARFMRLMKIKTHAELFPAMIRLIHLAGESSPLADLIKSVYRWTDDKTRREWTFRYFDKLSNAVKTEQSN